jgi:hypothetical protein
LSCVKFLFEISYLAQGNQSIQDTMINEITRQKNRQIARTLDDLADLKLPKLVEDRIKQGFYDFAENLIKLIQATQNDKSSNK